MKSQTHWANLAQPYVGKSTEPYLWARGRGKARGKRLIVKAGLTVGGREI